LTSASEVLDYLRAYHGDTENVRKLAEGFAERKLERKVGAAGKEDAASKLAKANKEAAIDANTPNKANRRRRGKGKEMDPSLLGFTAASSRIMQGPIDHGN